jgi:hypothetical protein
VKRLHRHELRWNGYKMDKKMGETARTRIIADPKVRETRKVDTCVSRRE